MRQGDAAEVALAALRARGFAKARASATVSERHELNAEFGAPSLLRTTHDTTLSLLGIVDDKQATVAINKSDDAAIAAAVEELWQMAQAAKPDPAHDIAAAQSVEVLEVGDPEPDHGAMFLRMKELLDHTTATYPTLRMGQSILSFTHRQGRFLNSNGVDFRTRRGSYGASLMFTAREGTAVSSFNYTGFNLARLDRPLAECATADALMRQTTEQVRTRRIPGKFTGELVITPDCLENFLGFLAQRVGDLPLIAGTSVYAGKLGESVSSTALTLESRPQDLIGGYFLTGDGYRAENTVLLEHGVLRSYLLSLYGAHKTGLARARTAGGAWVVQAGSRPLDEILRDVRQGVLITRFSGGAPNDRGDFSGVAKNSYYIENGEIRHPIAETMISGNMAQLLQNVVEVSKERADFGDSILPWCRVDGVGVS
jgi:PmbA protein